MAGIDLDARRAQRAEANAEPITVVLGGDKFDFLPAVQWPVEAVDRLRDGDFIGGLRELMGSAEDVRRFLAVKPTMGDLAELFDELFRIGGLGGLGNFSGSPSS